MLSRTLTILLVLSLIACDQQKFREIDSKKEAYNKMRQTDSDFSKRSAQVGMKKAFVEYMDPDAVMLRPNRMPIIGADAVQFLSSLNDSNYSLTWRAIGGNLSGSEDLGYTYGIYTIETTDTVYKGTYLTVWEKQDNGSWKFVIDTGNEGIGKEEVIK